MRLLAPEMHELASEVK